MTSAKSDVTKLTYADLEHLPADLMRHEIIDGDHLVSAAPNTYHQTLSRRIQFQLYTQIELPGHGVVFNAPTDLVLSPSNVVEPDLIVVLAARRSIVTAKNIQGVPDLVVEIVSESTERRDRGDKQTLFARFGVPEYWIVDGEARVVEQLILSGNAYVPAVRCTDRVTFRGREGVCVDLARVWDQ